MLLLSVNIKYNFANKAAICKMVHSVFIPNKCDDTVSMKTTQKEFLNMTLMKQDLLRLYSLWTEISYSLSAFWFGKLLKRIFFV